jgi:ABC-type phosphate transport system substrate-binding protein
MKLRLLQIVLATSVLTLSPAFAIHPSLPPHQKGDGISGQIRSVGPDTLINEMNRWSKAFMALYPDVKITEFIKYILSKDGQTETETGGFYSITNADREADLKRLGIIPSASNKRRRFATIVGAFRRRSRFSSRPLSFRPDQPEAARS